MLVQVQLVLWVLGQQVTDLLIVDFEVTGSDQELSLLGVGLDLPEDVLERSGHDTLIDIVL